MKTRLGVFVCCICTLILLPALGHAELGNVFYIRASGGFAFPSLSDLQDALDKEAEWFVDDSLMVDYEDFGPAFGFGIDMGARVTPLISIGGGFNYEKCSVENTASSEVETPSGGVEFYTADNLDLSLWDISAHVAFWVPSAPGLYFGVNAGYGSGKIEENFVAEISGIINDSFTGKGDYDGSGFVGGFFAGFQHEFESVPLVFVEAGYRLRNLGEFTGNFSSEMSTGDEDLKEDGPFRILDEDADPVGDINFSGFYIRAGVGIAFDL